MGIFTGNNGEVFIIDLPSLPERTPSSSNVSISSAVKDAFRLKRQEELTQGNIAAFESIDRNEGPFQKLKTFTMTSFESLAESVKGIFPSLDLGSLRGTLISTIVLIVVSVFVVMFLLTFVQKKATNLAGG